MKKYLPLALITILSCTYKSIPLKGTYAPGPYETISARSFDQVWTSIIDLFSQKGIGIKLIDRSSGLIVAQNTSAPITYEDKDGNLEDPNAWIVYAKVIDPATRKPLKINTASIEWNIHIKSTPENKTLININMVETSSVTSVVSSPYSTHSSTTTYKYKPVSTGVFEKLISDQIK